MCFYNELSWIKTTQSDTVVRNDRLASQSPPLSSSALSLPSNNDYTDTSHCPSAQKHKFKGKHNYYSYFCVDMCNKTQALRVFSVYSKCSPLGICVRELRSLSRPVTHLYARATSCLLQASTQLANWANTYTLKLKWVQMLIFQKNQQVVEKLGSETQGSPYCGVNFSFHFSTN